MFLPRRFCRFLGTSAVALRAPVGGVVRDEGGEEVEVEATGEWSE